MSRHASAPERRATAVGRFAVSLPDRVQLVALAAFLVISVTTTFRVFTPLLVVPAVVVVAVALWFLAPRHRTEPTRAALIGTAGSIVIAAVWLVANAPFVAEWFDPSRDPGLYLMKGLWLGHHSSPLIDVSQAQGIVAGIPGLTAAFGPFTGAVNFSLQGGDLLPGVIGAATWFGGVRAGLAINLVVGAVGLIAMYGLARRVVGPLWALVPELALGFSVAYMYFSRGTYSEIIMVLVGCAALTWLVSGVRSGAWTDFAVAGAFTGVATMTRIDGVLAGAGALLVLAVAGLGFAKAADRTKLVIGGAAFVVSGTLFTALGVYGLYRNSNYYFETLGSRSSLLWKACGVLVVLFAICWLAGRILTPDRLATFWRRVAPVAGSLVLAVLLFWLSRPLWYVAHNRSAVGASTIEGLQKLQGLPLDGTRSYEEQTMAWIGWYFGWPLVVLAIAGFALLIHRGVRHRRVVPLVVALAPLSAAAVYFTNVSITPDQVWAFRRLLPVITPGFLLAGMVPIALTWKRFPNAWVRVGAVVAACLVAFGPLVTWNGLLLVGDYKNQYTEIETVCRSLGDAKTVLLVRDAAPAYYGLSIRTTCDVNVVSAWSFDIKGDTLQKLHAKTGDVPVVAFNVGGLKGAEHTAQPNLTVTVEYWNRYIDKLPDSISSTTRTLYLGTLQADGQVAHRAG